MPLCSLAAAVALPVFLLAVLERETGSWGLVVGIVCSTGFVVGVDICFEWVGGLLDGTVVLFERVDEGSERMSIEVCAFVVNVVGLLFSWAGFLFGSTDKGSVAVCVEVCGSEVVGGVGILLCWTARFLFQWMGFLLLSARLLFAQVVLLFE